MRTLFLSILSLAFASTVFAAKPAILDNVELKWRATTDLKDLVDANLGALPAKITIAKFKDARTVEPKNKVGENKEDEKGGALPVTTSSDVSDFVTENLRQTLKKSGLDVVDSGGTYTLNGEITDYFVTETNTYQGNLMVKLTLTKGGKVVWKNTVIGTNKRFGRSYKLDNYLETLSDTVVDFATKLAQNSDFKAQLK